MEFGVLGPLAVWTDDGQPVRVPEAKVRALLASLLIAEGRPVSADRLADDLWGDEPPGNPVNTLQTKVSQLRRALDHAQPGARELVAFLSHGYVLRADAVDAARFAALAARARAATDPRTKAGLLADALALWRGPAYADFRDEEFAGPAATRLDELRLTVREEQAEVRLELGEHSLLADELSELVAEHPLRERLRAAHLRALYRSGRQSEALEGYGELRRVLADELGLDPSPELAALHQAMLQQDPALAPAPVPATSAARPATNLPAPLTGLVGRDDDVARVRALLGTSRLVTLTGPGGVGKTRLALAAAAELDGAWLVELAGLRATPGDDAVAMVADLIAAELGIRDTNAPLNRAAASPRQLAEALRAQRLVLVLDNCEHLVEPVAELVGLLLSTAPQLRVLATSQESLAIPGETLHVVDPLGLPGSEDPQALRESAAVQLFMARAVAAAPGFVLDEESAPWVAAICRHLDGLPLALELAAARIRGLGARGLAERLDDRFHLLKAEARGRPARQRTLRAMIDWSWEQLTEDQRTVLIGLAVHPGGCAPAAIEAVCPGLDVMALVDQLVNRSMAVPSADLRYRLLESVAAYCLERADDHVHERRDAYYADLAERAEPHLHGHRQRAWLERLDTEALNLRATLNGPHAERVARALAWYWYLRGRWREAHRVLSDILGPDDAWSAGFAILTGEGRDLLEHPRDVLDSLQPRQRWFLAQAHLHFGDGETGRRLNDQALEEFRAAGDRWGEAAALASRTRQAMLRSDLELAERSGTSSLALFTELGDRWGQLQAWDQLAYLAEVTGDYAAAGRLHRDGLRGAEELRLWGEVSYRLASLGRIALLNGDFERSREFHERGMRLAAEQSHSFAEEFARVGLGLVARRSGDLGTAEHLFRESLAWNRRLEADYGLPFYGVTLLLAELGFVAELRGEAAAARKLHEEGLAAAREQGDPRAIALATEGLAGVAALEGAREEAIRLLDEAQELRESIGAPLPAAERGDVDRVRTSARGA